MRQKEPADIVHICGIQQFRDLWTRQMRLVKLLSRAEGSDERAVMTCQDDGARASLFALFDLVSRRDAFTLVGGLELGRKLVITDAASVDDRVGRKDILGIALETRLREKLRYIRRPRVRRSERHLPRHR